jgi:hypothetical protein
LAEESAPVEAEVRREAEVVRQVLDSDRDLELSIPSANPSAPTTAHSSPNLPMHDNIDEICEDAMIMDSGLGLSGSFRPPYPVRAPKRTAFWEGLSEASSIRTTPPPPLFPHRGSSSGISTDDTQMDSPSTAYSSQAAHSQMHHVIPPGGIFPMAAPAGTATTSSSGGDTPHQQAGGAPPPTAAEITRRINSKRRRDDDFDPVSFKRRAVSPGMSVHNSPIMQSPLQRDMAPWGSRPGSNGGDKSGAPSDSGGSQGQCAAQAAGGRVNGGSNRRIGFQGMVDTNDGITKLSIE